MGHKILMCWPQKVTVGPNTGLLVCIKGEGVLNFKAGAEWARDQADSE